jgi:hypothetical protein
VLVVRATVPPYDGGHGTAVRRLFQTGGAAGFPQRRCEADAVEAKFTVRIDDVRLRRPCTVLLSGFRSAA